MVHWLDHRTTVIRRESTQFSAGPPFEECDRTVSGADVSRGLARALPYHEVRVDLHWNTPTVTDCLTSRGHPPARLPRGADEIRPPGCRPQRGGPPGPMPATRSTVNRITRPGGGFGIGGKVTSIPDRGQGRPRPSAVGNGRLRRRQDRAAGSCAGRRPRAGGWFTGIARTASSAGVVRSKVSATASAGVPCRLPDHEATPARRIATAGVGHDPGPRIRVDVDLQVVGDLLRQGVLPADLVGQSGGREGRLLVHDPRLGRQRARARSRRLSGPGCRAGARRSWAPRADPRQAPRGAPAACPRDRR